MALLKDICKRILFCIFLVLVIVLFYNGTILKTTQEQIKTQKVILFWTTFFGRNDFEFGLGRKPFSVCNSVEDCWTTTDRSLLDQSDAVVFHIRDFNKADLPVRRLPHQRWIFFLLESPEHTPDILKNLDSFFNWTMTYRVDSDVYFPYSVAESSGIDRKLAEKIGQNFSHRKTKLVAWFVSNCQTASKRERYVAELQKHIQVDVYGNCGSLKCPYRGRECYEMLEKDYKFYLSFENSVCLDYVTEKFYNALLYKTVPIVYGGFNYSGLAPRNSFIDIHNFSSARTLADYLNFLDKNDDEYMKYFEWINTPPGMAVLPRYFQPWCNLCQMLHDSSLPVKSYKDIHSWWFNQGNCRKESPPSI